MFGRRRRIIRRRRSFRGAGCLLVILVLGLLLFVFLRAVRAQSPVTYDDVNAVAVRMYCPECENVPLDKCYTPVCTQWKQEIAEQLAAGRSSDQIVADFVARFGDEVVGVPQESGLRTLTLAAPLILALAAAALGLTTLYRLRLTRASRDAGELSTSDTNLDSYRARLEEDLRRET